MEISNRSATLINLPTLSKFPIKIISSLAKNLDRAKNKVEIKFKNGQNIFHQGTPTYGIFSIISGKVKISKISKLGKETIIAIATVGDILGDSCIFSGPLYSTTATAMDETVVSSINKRYFNDLLANDPTMSNQLLEKMGKEIKLLENRLIVSHQKNVLQRLAILLLELNNEYGEKREDGTFILNIKISREELASLVATAPETLIRTISDLKSSNIISQDGKSLVIMNKKILETIADSETNYSISLLSFFHMMILLQLILIF